MRVVLDTNVVVSGLLWRGTPHDVLALVESGRITACATQEMLDELGDVLRRPKFRTATERRQTSTEELIASVAAATRLFDAVSIALPRGLRDRDDAMIVACALASRADCIITGDEDLLELKELQGIQIVTPDQFLSKISQV